MRIRFYGCLLAILTLVFSVGTASAQQPAAGTITGRITDKENQAGVSGATVEAQSGGRTVASTTTDTDGEYRIVAAAGTYVVVVQMVGYETFRIEGVRVIAGESSMAGAALTSQAFLLNPVVVSASKAPEKALDAPARVEVVSERQIEERPTTTPVDHLRSTPGVDVITTGIQSTNVVARGFNNIFSGALHTLTDYRAARIPSLHVNFLHFIPQIDEDMGRMEVVLGPGAALYGPNTSNGVLHILTKSPLDDPSTTFSLAGGEQSFMHVTGRTSHLFSENFGFKLSGQYLRADEWENTDSIEIANRALATNNFAAFAAQQPFDPVTGQPYPTSVLQQRAALVGNRDFDVERWSADARADWRVSPSLTVVASGGLTNANGIELTGIGAGQTQDWRYSYAQLRTSLGKFFAQTYVNMSDAGDTYLLRTGAPIVDKSKVWALQGQHSADIGTWQAFTYGLDYIKTMPETESTINGRNESDDNYDEFGAYLQSTTRLHRMFDLIGALRYDTHSHLEDPVWSPRAAVIFKPTDNHNLRVSYNRAFSTPTSLNLFLDIDAGPLGPLGAFGFRARAFAPGSEGISFRNAAGEIGVSSPFAAGGPTTFTVANSANIYQLQVTAAAGAAAARGQPIPAQVVSMLRTDAGIQAALTQLPLVAIDPIGGTQSLFNSTTFNDVSGIEESTTASWEIGYKGLFGERILFAADAWWSKQKNFTSPLIAATPLLLVAPTQLAGVIIQRLMANGVSQAQATAIAQGLVQLPGGVISAPGVQGNVPELLVTYVNYGEISLNGLDFSATALLSDTWQVGATASFVSDDHFMVPLQGDTQFVALNAPSKKGSAHITYRSLTNGFNGEIRGRYTAEFPANSAGYVGTSCVTNDPATGKCVESFMLLDVTAGYRLPVSGASVQLHIQNLFDEKYQSFVGTPEIGRMAILRLKYEL
jgi:outer membrane receptor for ferrienterochelin and colicins